jgi:hypothetical protein
MTAAAIAISLRNQFLSGEIFATLREAKVLIQDREQFGSAVEKYSPEFWDRVHAAARGRRGLKSH